MVCICDKESTRRVFIDVNVGETRSQNDNNNKGFLNKKKKDKNKKQVDS